MRILSERRTQVTCQNNGKHRCFFDLTCHDNGEASAGVSSDGGTKVSAKVFITNETLLRQTTEQKLKTFLEDYRPATIASVRRGEGVLTVIEAATSEQAGTVAAALASSSLSTEPLSMVPEDSAQGQQLVQLFSELTQRELEMNWTNRQW